MKYFCLFAAAIMFYFPYLWCRVRKEDGDVYGLRWVFDAGAVKFTLSTAFVALLPLTFLALLLRGGVTLPTGKNIPYMILAGLSSAVIEETFYRGWLQPVVKKNFGLPFSVVLVNLLFAVSHLLVVSPRRLALLTFFPGIIMSFLKEKYDNIFPPFLFHFLCNLWAIFFSPLSSAL